MLEAQLGQLWEFRTSGRPSHRKVAIKLWDSPPKGHLCPHGYKTVFLHIFLFVSVDQREFTFFIVKLINIFKKLSFSRRAGTLFTTVFLEFIGAYFCTSKICKRWILCVFCYVFVVIVQSNCFHFFFYSDKLNSSSFSETNILLSPSTLC